MAGFRGLSRFSQLSAARGSSASRSPSPSRLNDSTSRKIDSARPDRHPRRVVDEVLGGVQHAAPARRRRLLAEAEERQAGLGDDRRGDRQRRLHDQRRRRCWAARGAARCASGGLPTRARRLDVVLDLDAAAPAPRVSRTKIGVAEMPIAIIALVRLGPEEGGQRDRQDQERAGQQGVGDARDHARRPSRRDSPASRPIGTPSSSEIDDRDDAGRAARPARPRSRATSTSRPISSVPNQCAGDRRLADRASSWWRSGRSGAIQRREDAPAAMKTSTITPGRPSRPCGARSRRQARRARARPAASAGAVSGGGSERGRASCLPQPRVDQEVGEVGQQVQQRCRRSP